MNELLKRVIAIAILVTIILGMSITVSADLYHWGDESIIWGGLMTPRLTTPCDAVKFYISSVYYLKPYKTQVQSGILSWNTSSFSNIDIDLVETSTYSESVIDIKTKNSTPAILSDESGTLGKTIVYCGDGPFSGNNTSHEVSEEIPDDYFMAEVYLDVNIIKTMAGDDEEKIKNFFIGVTAHEIGHCLGLSHTINDMKAVMRWGHLDVNVFTPSNNEKEAVCNLYTYTRN